MTLRVGTGYDIHRLVDGRKLFLGGIELPFPKGLLGHSDGDALLHAICDALLGACGKGDIGTHFPDTAAELKGIASIELLKRTLSILNKDKPHKIVNIDTTVVCDRPRLSGHIPAMRQMIAKALDIEPDLINIKAKTTEETAVSVVSAYAVVLVETEEK